VKITTESELLDSIRLTKTTRGYSWEIKRYYNWGAGWSNTIASLKEINEEMMKTFKQDDTQD